MVNDATSIIRSFSRAGYPILGFGCYSAVFDAGHCVYKVGINKDDPFLDYVMDFGGIHVPKIYQYWDTDSCWVAKLEKLEPLDRQGAKFQSLIKCGNFVSEDPQKLPPIFPPSFVDTLLELKKYVNDFPEIVMDLHLENFMMRGEQIVINDPLAHENPDSNLQEWFWECWDKEDECKNNIKTPIRTY